MHMRIGRPRRQHFAAANFLSNFMVWVVYSQYPLPYAMPEGAAKKKQSIPNTRRRSTSRRPPTAQRSTSRPPTAKQASSRPPTAKRSSSRPGRSSSRPATMKQSASRPPTVKPKSRSMMVNYGKEKSLNSSSSKGGRRKAPEQLQRAKQYRQVHN